MSEQEDSSEPVVQTGKRTFNKEWDVKFKCTGDSFNEVMQYVETVNEFADDLFNELRNSEEMEQLSDKYKELAEEKYEEYHIEEITEELTDEEKEELES